MQQTQPPELHFGEERGVSEVIGFNLRRRRAIRRPAIRADEQLLRRGGFGRLRQQLVDLGLVEKVGNSLGRVVGHGSGYWITKSEKYTCSTARLPSAWL